MPYLEDIGLEEERHLECPNCAHEGDVSGTHYLDSETYRWQCEKCSYTNEISAPAEEPDPDEAYDRWRDERNGLTFP